uniref:gluconokinase n=1 Tax=Heterorhabditis bacteriophora TaxID=37862 RepID=A0A1I7XMR9_HETBA
MSCDILVVMGVSGCGKTTIGKQLAEKIGWEFKDADDFHSEGSVESMRKGVPLTDVDRVPWLLAINEFCKSNKKSSVRRTYKEKNRPFYVYFTSGKSIIYFGGPLTRE